MSADLKHAEITIQQMNAEIQALTEKVKVGFEPGALNYAMLKAMIYSFTIKYTNKLKYNIYLFVPFCRPRRPQHSQTGRRRRGGSLTWRVPLRV